jgi:hypothetical protein
MCVRIIVASMLLAACVLQPPPAIDPATQTQPASEEPASVAAEPAAEPGPQDDDSAKLEQMMADPECLVEVVDVLKSSRAFWSDTRKYACTYEVVINGQRYKYTRQLPKDRRSEPEAICERGVATTDEAVRDATHECKDLQAGQRPVTGLIPIR